MILISTYAQVAEVIEQALANGRAKLHAEAAVSQGPADDPEFEDATVEQLSDAALIASSVLAAHLANDPHKVRKNILSSVNIVTKPAAPKQALTRPRP